VLAACSSDRDGKPTDLASSDQLQRDQNQRDKWTYRAQGVDFSKYRRFQFEPVAVYAGPDGSFGSISASDRHRLADIVGEQFTRVIGEKYSVVGAAGPDVARIRVTLLGVEGTVGGVATVSRILPVGIAVNAAKGVAGGSGSFTGSIEVAVEAFDSQSNDLLAAGIRRATPAVYDIEATFSTTETVRSSASGAATALREAIDKIQKK
jgi:hypothetical protein